MSSVRFALLAAIAVLHATTSTAHPSARILGGEEAVTDAFPYVVSLRLDNVHICGGNIIDEWHILTAGHCVADRNIKPHTVSRLSVRVGSMNQFAGGKIFHVSKVHIHKGYTGYQDNIAVLRLSKALEWGKRIAPIALALSNGDEPPVAAEVTVAGWGKRDSDAATYKLRYDSFTVANETVCADAFTTYDASILCLTHVLKRGSCTGDAGNGAVYKNKLVAVFNFVVGACGSRYPDVFIKVAHYATWIQDVVNLES